jgi:hypothetical protein
MVIITLRLAFDILIVDRFLRGDDHLSRLDVRHTAKGDFDENGTNLPAGVSPRASDSMVRGCT